MLPLFLMTTLQIAPRQSPQSELKGQRLILHVDRDSLAAMQETVYKIFTGLSRGLVKVLKDPDVKKEEKAPKSTSSKLDSEGEDETPASSNDREGDAGGKGGGRS
jgi:hypothetical protein